MKKLHTFRWPLAALLSLAVSILFLLLSLKQGLGNSFLKNGDWRTSKSTGSSEAGAIDKTVIAIGGLLASTREDSIYYILNSVAGEPIGFINSPLTSIFVFPFSKLIQYQRRLMNNPKQIELWSTRNPRSSRFFQAPRNSCHGLNTNERIA